MKKKIERIIPQPAAPGMVGDGFRVYNYIPGAGVSQQRISPFLLLDFNAEVDFPPSEALRGVGVHPHRGFETVTISYKGSVAHHDSAGNSGTIHPGDVQWMTAGAGILHKEYHDKEYAKKGGPFEMVQLWVNLPKKNKLTPPHYQAIKSDQLGVVELPDNQGRIRVIAGEYNGIAGPAQTYSPVQVADIRLKKGGSTSTSLPAGYNTAILVIDGSASINGATAAKNSFVLFSNEGDEISITAEEDAVLLLLSGEPIDEPIVSYGPFVMNTQSEIIDSIREFQSGKYGVLE
ncbi:MAG TPA: pirin family protein [Puia sp.]|jgi:redox-sensitive bicupin YhaK (pirin superfamily)|nr:pirin family protein [Puia sp.]